MNDRLSPDPATAAEPHEARPRVADALARTLHAHGIRHAFGMPGGEVVTLVDALEAAGIRFVLMRQESAAAIAAAATSLITGAPGLLVTTLGPGLANAVNGIADAVQERMPLLVLSGAIDADLRGRYTHQVIDHAALMRGAGVKASFAIEPAGAAATLARALRLSQTPPFGPVHLDLAPGAAAAPLPDGAPSIVGPTRSVRQASDPADAALAEMRGFLARASRPLIVAGFEAARTGAAPALRRLSEAQGIPVVTTYKGKGLVDESHPLSLGAAGLSPKADAVLLPLARVADLVLLVGCDPIEWRPGWLNPFAPEARIVELTEAAPDHGMLRADLSLAAPLGPALDALAGAPAVPRWPAGEVEAARASLKALFDIPEAWGPHAVFETLAQALPAEATTTVDSGAHRILFSQQWRARRPLSVLQSAGWCTMGAALPLAIGAALAEPGRPVVAILGDGGFEMTMGELGTLRDQGLPVIALVLQDASLALIELKQRQAGLARAGVALGRTDLALTAQAFGGSGATVRDRPSLTGALAAALGRPHFSLIACEIDASSYAGRI